MKNKEIAGLIEKKATGQLKIAIASFLVSLLLLGVFSVLFLNQYYQVNDDFINNKNIHVIEISSRMMQKHAAGLKFKDVGRIKKIIEETGKKSDVFSESSLSFGVNGKNADEGYNISSISDDTKLLKDSAKVRDDTMYAEKLKSKSEVLQIPVVDVQKGGYSASNFYDLPVKIKGGSKLSDYLFLTEDDVDRTQVSYISYNTYKKIIEKCYKTSWDDFTKRYDDDEDFGTAAVSRIFVDVEKISNVEAVAKAVSEDGYNTNYTFKAFDNFDESMKATLLISVMLIVLITVVTGLSSLYSFKAYLKVQKKDMGILKHYGYTAGEIQKIYSRNVNKVFIFVAAAAIAFSMVLAVIMLREYNIISGLIMSSLAVIIPTVIVNLIIKKTVIKKYSKESILDLIKKSKEFE